VNPALQGYLAAMEETLAADGGQADAGAQLHKFADIVEGNTALLLAVNDGSVPVSARRGVLDRLLDGKCRPEVGRLVHQAVSVVPAGEVVSSFRWMGTRLDHLATRASATAAEPFDEDVLGRLGSRNRVSGYAAAVFESCTVADLEEIEDQLFRFARTIESNRRLRGALGDRDLPVVVRQEVIAKLLGGKSLSATVRLASYAARGGRARDIVSTLDTLVEDAAKARGWRVARVSAADVVDDDQQRDLSDALAHLTGNPVDLQVSVDPTLLGGVVVQVGDLLVDSSTRHRLDELKEHVLASEEAYRIPGTPTRREATDG
jgi:F-type H+-transporting ATPase subunit delta